MVSYLSILLRRPPSYSILDAKFFDTNPATAKFQRSNTTVGNGPLEVSASVSAVNEMHREKQVTCVATDLYILVPESEVAIYGNWLIDIIPKYFVAQSKTDRRVKIIVVGAIPDFVKGILLFLNLDPNLVCSTDQLLVVEPISIFEVSDLRYFDFYNILAFRRQVKPKINVAITAHGIQRPLQQGRFFLSRSNWGQSFEDTRSLVNGIEVEEYFLSHGFEVVHPENYTTLELVSKLHNAEIVAGEAGSALHISIFCSSRTRFINLQSFRQEHLIQSTLCAINRQRIAYIWGRNETAHWSSNFSVDVRSLERGFKLGLLD